MSSYHVFIHSSNKYLKILFVCVLHVYECFQPPEDPRRKFKRQDVVSLYGPLITHIYASYLSQIIC